MKHLCLLSLSSFNLEFIVGDILTLNTFLGDVDEADDTTGWCVTEASESDAALHKLLRLVSRHILTVVGVDIAPDEGTARATEGPVAILEVTWGINLVDLVAFVGVPAGTDHGCREGILIGINDLAHHSGSWLYRGESTELWGLDVHVVADIASDSTGVRGSTGSLAIDALMDRL